MLKKYGKAIEQPQETLPLHLHSEQMDGQSTKSKRRWAGRQQGPCAEWSLALPPAGRDRAAFPTWIPCPLPSTERGLLRKAEPWGCKVLEAEGEGDRGSPSRHC